MRRPSPRTRGTVFRREKVSKFEIYEVDGHPFLKTDLNVVLLSCAQDEKFFNLEREFDDAKDDIKKGINTGIDYWKMGSRQNKRHHGWTASQYNGSYTNCYVFKHLAKKVRVYGYLVRPNPHDRIVCCVLMHYAIKKESETDEEILKDLVRLGENPGLKMQVEIFYKEYLQNKEETDES